MATETQKEMLNRLYKKYGLSPEDIHVSTYYKIITRAGIQKIEAASNAIITFENLYQSDTQCRFLFTATKVDSEGNTITIKTTGEASEDNVKQQPKYLAAMAEKRGRSRAILTIEGLYKEGFYGQDEAEDFDQEIKKSRRSALLNS